MLTTETTAPGAENEDRVEMDLDVVLTDVVHVYGATNAQLAKALYKAVSDDEPVIVMGSDGELARAFTMAVQICAHRCRLAPAAPFAAETLEVKSATGSWVPVHFAGGW